MLTVKLILEDAEMPRTVFWEKLLAALAVLPTTAARTIYLPQEDAAMETNWPRYRNRASSYVRGMGHDLSAQGMLKKYFDRIIAWARAHPRESILVFNMNPFIRISTMLRGHGNIYVADGCLTELDRSLNPRSISMPAMPMQVSGRAYANEGRRKYLASFQGAPSHPVRAALRQIHDGEKFVIHIIDPTRHSTLKLDATTGRADDDYRDIMENADFAFIPRGDALFSYRLLEAMSFGCIPIILSDNWVLPFHRLIDWSSCSLRPREDEVEGCVALLKRLSDAEILHRKRKVLEIYQRYFASLETILTQGVLVELEQCLAQKP
jgi:hypothetical protein